MFLLMLHFILNENIGTYVPTTYHFFLFVFTFEIVYCDCTH